MRLLPILCVLASTAFGGAQDEGRRIVDQALAALGGDAFRNVKDRVETGRAYSFTKNRLRGLSRATISTLYLSRAEDGQPAVVERQSFGKEEEYGAVLFAGGKGYEITFRGARPLPQDTLERYEQTTLHNIFYIMRQRLNEPGMIFESMGWEIFDNQPVDVVRITDSENRQVLVSFLRSSKLPIRQVFVRRDPKTRDRFEEESIYSKYREIGGGVQWPFSIQRTRNGEKIFEMYSDTVQVNQNLPESLFKLPNAVKMLEPLE